MKTIILFLLIFITTLIYSQSKLKPGFDANEYSRLLEITDRQADSTRYGGKYYTPYPAGYEMVYRSDVTGMDNRWDLWLSSDSVCVISIRGTTVSETSWLEDFYSPMVKASGFLVFGKDKLFSYTLASDTNAAVHTGFLIGLSAVAPGIVEKINEYYNKGIKDFILMGHSHRAALTYLLRSYLHYLPGGTIPGDVTFKTYCSAPPKPGNLFYAYDHEFITRGGWQSSVSNVVDWVPQMPITVQTKFDFNKNDPFTTVDSTLAANLGLLPRIVIGLIQKSMLGSLDGARDVMTKYLGKDLYKIVESKIPGFVEPRYYPSMDYMTCGSPVILKPNAAYYEAFEKAPGIAGLFTHHMPNAYYFLLKEIYPDK
ncbi:MAG: lipase family protein [Ignavibacteria bacterium]|nr:lipase family protein [Ignavibacteria bacterium]